jgi:hypothetical protein
MSRVSNPTKIKDKGEEKSKEINAKTRKRKGRK